ncbi:unnamed protein product [Ascophyllum nodosum]
MRGQARRSPRRITVSFSFECSVMFREICLGWYTLVGILLQLKAGLVEGPCNQVGEGSKLSMMPR